MKLSPFVLLLLLSTQGYAASANRAEIHKRYEGYRKDFPGISEIQASELKLLKPGSFVLVDTRDEKEQAVSMLPLAMTQSEFEQRVWRHPKRFEKLKVIVYCTIGYRSGKYTHKMQQKFKSISNLVGGILDWTHESGDLIDAAGKSTKRVHVWAKDFNLVADDYEGTW